MDRILSSGKVHVKNLSVEHRYVEQKLDKSFCQRCDRRASQNSAQYMYSETCLQRPPYILLVCLLELIQVTTGHLDELQKTEYGRIDNYVSPVINK